jgi:hypothetical protein
MHHGSLAFTKIRGKKHIYGPWKSCIHKDKWQNLAHMYAGTYEAIRHRNSSFKNIFVANCFISQAKTHTMRVKSSEPTQQHC